MENHCRRWLRQGPLTACKEVAHALQSNTKHGSLAQVACRDLISRCARNRFCVYEASGECCRIFVHMCAWTQEDMRLSKECFLELLWKTIAFSAVQECVINSQASWQVLDSRAHASDFIHTLIIVSRHYYLRRYVCMYLRTCSFLRFCVCSRVHI